MKRLGQNYISVIPMLIHFYKTKKLNVPFISSYFTLPSGHLDKDFVIDILHSLLDMKNERVTFV